MVPAQGILAGGTAATFTSYILFRQSRPRGADRTTERRSQERLLLFEVISTGPLGPRHMEEFIMGRGILLWLLGIPIPIIILILLFVR